MKQSSIIILLTMFMSTVSIKSFAHDIEVKNSDGITIYYNWINDHQDLSVTFQGSKINSMKYSGNVARSCEALRPFLASELRKRAIPTRASRP